jgi:hypothetical protein
MILRVGRSPDALEPVPFEQGDSYRVQPGTIHMIEAVTDVDVLEASTAHLDDVVRFTDRYGRAPSGTR